MAKYKATLEIPCYLKDGRFMGVQMETAIFVADDCPKEALQRATVQMVGVPRIVKLERIENGPDFQD